MPAWITIIVDDLNEARVAELIEALRTEALAVSQPDPMPGIIAKVVNEVRSCIGFCASTVVDANPTTIPPNLKDMVVQKIVRTMKGRLLQSLTKDEISEEDVYQVRLKLLTQCAWPVDKTDTPVGTPNVQATTGVELASNSRRRATQNSLNAL